MSFAWLDILQSGMMESKEAWSTIGRSLVGQKEDQVEMADQDKRKPTGIYWYN